ncbi:MAG: hypothetical protein D6678_07275 [Zetaproteobacteria bacterium]|nr:MAG: hypothetical protein D6678_07275 [Zetaproteobacteria bacterium]
MCKRCWPAAFKSITITHMASRLAFVRNVLLLCGLICPSLVIAGTASTLLGPVLPASVPPITPSTLNNPQGVARDALGNVYIADTGNHRVLKLDVNLVVSVLAGTGVAGFVGDGGPAKMAQLNTPVDVEVDTLGNVYIADSLNHRIRKVDVLTGLITTVAGSGVTTFPVGDGGPATAATLNTPKGLDVDAGGNLFIADTLHHLVRKVDTAGVISTVAGTGVAGFSGDTGLATAAQLNTPRDVAVGSGGVLYISDQLNHRIREVSSNGVIMTFAGTGVPGPLGNGGDATLAQLNQPAGIEVDADGRVYVADTLNHQIRMIDTHSVIIGLMGISATPTALPATPLGDLLPSKQASLHLPNDVVDTAAGELIVADQINNRIRLVSGGDTDWDDVPDVNDAFPLDASASVDGDGDGAPDAWNANASLMQIGASSLKLDQFPTDPLRQTVAWEAPFGVNLAGGEFAPNVIPGVYGVDYIYPNATELDYYRSKGFTYLRLPILWERLQPALLGPLSTAELARIDAVVSEVRTRGMKLIIELHNFARYRGVIVTGPQLADVWGKLAAHYANESAIYGYDLMNEPNGPWPVGSSWQVVAQAAVDAIRAVDQVHAVIVAGDGFSTAFHWELYNNTLTITDPAGNLIFEAHQYFDADSSGRYLGANGLRYHQTYQSAHGSRTYQDVIAERLYVFVGWLKKHGYRGILGEFGVPANPGLDPAWVNLLPPMLNYLQAENVGWLYWSGGPWWGTDALSIEPANLINGPDRPQMSVMLPLMDSDKDGVSNDQDAFPSDFVAWLDADGDKHPDAWNPAATAAQIAASGLILDEFPNDPTRWHVSPTANNDFATTVSGRPVLIHVLSNDLDPDPLDPISLLSADPASQQGGTVTVDTVNGTVTYTPPANFTGTDSFLYTIQDLKQAKATATVTVTVELDSDGDGVPDSRDAFPFDPAASLDSDGDGHPDKWNANATTAQIQASQLTLDAFPFDPAAFLDSDGDGHPDAWNPNATQAQIAASKLTLDAFPNNPSLWIRPVRPMDDVVAVFNTGLKVYFDANTWQIIDPGKPRQVLTGDLDGNGLADVIADFAVPLGLRVYSNNGNWINLNRVGAVAMTTGDLDGNGADELIVDFGLPGGIEVYRNGAWVALGVAGAQRMTTGDLNGDGRDELIVDFGPGQGLRVYRSPGVWQDLAPHSAGALLVADMDGDGRGELIADFGPGLGVWYRQGREGWQRLTRLSIAHLATFDMDGNGKADLVLDFGAAKGIWLYLNGLNWRQVSTQTGNWIVTGDLDGDGSGDLVVDQGAGGISVFYHGSLWGKIAQSASQGLAVGNINGL